MDYVKTRDPRGEMRDDDASLALIDYPDSTEEIPTLDFAAYLEGWPGGLEEVAARLREVTTTVGFFYLKNHGVPQDLIDAAFAQNRRFHALADSEKMAVACKDDRTRIGYQGYRRKHYGGNAAIVSKPQPSLYAQVVFGRETGTGEPVHNLWPENLPGFRETVLAYHGAIEKLARSFLPLWCESLNLLHEYFDAWFENPHLQMALLHYPPQKDVGGRQYGIAPHTDNAMMTFLAQSEIPGLAVRMPSGHWRTVDPIRGTLLVNTGNTLVRWTNEEYLSTKHRVINTNTVDRYSIPVFFGPSNDTVVEVLPTCQGLERPPLYEPITYGDMREWYNGRAKKEG